MPVATFTQPDMTAQTGTAYKANIDACITVLKRIADNFAPRQSNPVAMTVSLDAGHLFNGTTLTEVAAQTTGTITAPVGNPRIDRVVVDRLTGVVSVITGTPAGSPVAPAITNGKLPVAQVLLQTSSTSITNSMITDERDLVALGSLFPVPVAADAFRSIQVKNDGSGFEFVGPVQTFKNRIINGDMRIDQRNGGGAINISTNGYTLDRWHVDSGVGGIITVQADASVPAGEGFTSSLKCTVQTQDASPAATDIYALKQFVEGFHFADAMFGAAAAKTVVLSFWVRSSITGTYAGALRNSAANRSYPFTYAIGAANTWEKKTVVIAGDTTGTWLTDAGIGVGVIFDLGSGSNANGIAGAWVAANNFRTAGSVTWIATAAASFYLTGVQLELGPVVTAFEHRPFSMELARCQRYFTKTFDISTAPAGGTGAGSQGQLERGSNPNTEPSAYWAFPVEMRTGPTVTRYNPRAGGAAGEWSNNASDTANARTLWTNTRGCLIDNGGIALAAGGQWFIAASASAEL